jgi:hypothetical protein
MNQQEENGASYTQEMAMMQEEGGYQPWVYHLRQFAEAPICACTKYIGYALPQSAFSDPSQDPTLHANWSQIPQDVHAQKNLDTIMSIITADVKNIRVVSLPPTVHNPVYNLQLCNPHGEVVTLNAQVMYGDYITFTTPFNNPAIARLHLTPEPDDHALYREILKDEIPPNERLTAYAVTRREHQKALILNVHTRLNPSGSRTKYLIFAAKSKKEIAKFLDHAFGIHIKYELERQKRWARANMTSDTDL